jgi:CDGSH-type Zn-finger protein
VKNPHSSQKTAKGKIRITLNGPYLVSGSIPLSEHSMRIDEDDHCHGWQEDKKYPVQETYALCRCGHSRSKPFCDGSHTTKNFDGTETASRTPYLEQSDVLYGSGITLTDAPDLCAGARFCDRAGGIWELTQEDSEEARETAIEEACDCPAGRLVIWDENNTAIEPHFEPSVALVNDVQAGHLGPVWVRGNVPIESSDGSTLEIRNRVTLCRCGKSDNKPYCDGAHLHG